MNEANYASLEASKRLVEAGMIAPMTCEEIFNNFGKSARVVLYSDAQAVERELSLKQDDWLKECQENDRLQAALAAAQGEVERMREVIETMILFIPDGWQMPLGWNQVVAKAQEAFGGKP